jgi:transmembrane sensor
MQMMFDPYRIAELIYRELKGELSDEERKVLDQWKKESQDNTETYRKITDEALIIKKINIYNAVDKKMAWKKLEHKLNSKSKKIHLFSQRFFKYAAAAVILLAVGGYLWLRLNEKSPVPIVADERIIIHSGTQKAILITSKEERIELGNVQGGQTIQLSATWAVDTDNTLSYSNKSSQALGITGETVMNTLETPRGGEYSVILSDGTKIYLNAETKLTFPEAFSDHEREVLLEGEAFFEVAHQAGRPFVVKTPSYNITVYGTSFNVSAYTSDMSSHTTLVEGSVGINTDKGGELKLNPGEQAHFIKTGETLSKRKVDTYVYTAWKNGEFVIANESLGSLMQRLGRWYDFDTHFVNTEAHNFHFSGTLGRYDSFDTILKMISLTTNISFETRGKTVYVTLNAKK